MKEPIILILTKVLSEDPSIEFAYLFGSFLTEEKYSDIDIGIYFSSLSESGFLESSDLKHKISRRLNAAGIPLRADDVDVVILNLISFRMLNRIFKEGKLLFERNSLLRAEIIEKNSIQIRSCLGILKEAELL